GASTSTTWSGSPPYRSIVAIPPSCTGQNGRMAGHEVFLLDAVRTPFGKLRGGLSHVRTDDLAAAPLRRLMARHPGLDPARVEDVYYGNTNGAGEENRNVARMAAL